MLMKFSTEQPCCFKSKYKAHYEATPIKANTYILCSFHGASIWKTTDFCLAGL